MISNNIVNDADMLGLQSIIENLNPGDDFELKFPPKLQTPLSEAESAKCRENIKRALDIIRKAIRDVPGCKRYFDKTKRCKGNLLKKLNDLEIELGIPGNPSADTCSVTYYKQCRKNEDGTFDIIEEYRTAEGGYTFINDGEWKVWMCPYACRLGRWQLANTIIHELYHECDDDPEEEGPIGAEDACGLTVHHIR